MSMHMRALFLAALLSTAAGASAAPPIDIESRAAALPFPVYTRSLRPGDEHGTLHHVPGLERPLFLVGDEPASRHWLRQQRDKLRTMNALGLVVEVKDRARFRSLQAIAPQLLLVPVGADAFAEQFPIFSYPALLTGAAR